ncbi:MAG: hypothetical protein JWQ09_5724 [Segetibacter sp.]|nr:hypothetical protein [Segetibacter sp.]
MAKAIEVKNLSKAYQLGEIGTGTISRDLERWFAKVRGKEDPFLKIGEANDRTSKGTSDVVWSLKDLNFEIEQGDAVGIIGRNGAGKSTLLKLLSRVTSPTSGEINVKGRIASLLEVGTGFHPELTGRENIFLNGAILGMRKKEITRKFDEIVDFAGVERFIDTPVKRYSSGMYVRLAFAVAAHLDSEILIVDEVLAVGDAEFQKRCLGKMGEVSKGEGRTVLFVSHSMASIKQLCTNSILLSQGKIEKKGITTDVINYYLSNNSLIPESKASLPINNSIEISFTSVMILNDSGKDFPIIQHDHDFFVQTSFTVSEEINNIEISLCFKNSSGVNVFFTSLSDVFSGNTLNLKKGTYSTNTRIRKYFLLPDTYTIDVYAHKRNDRNVDFHSNVIKFSIIDTGSYMAPYGKAANDFTCVLEICPWSLATLS